MYFRTLFPDQAAADMLLLELLDYLPMGKQYMLTALLVQVTAVIDDVIDAALIDDQLFSNSLQRNIPHYRRKFLPVDKSSH